MKPTLRLLAVFGVSLSVVSCQAPLLSVAENIVATIHPVASVNHRQLKEILDSSAAQNYLLFDTRSPEEYDTSFIFTAIRLDPGIAANEFVSRYGSHIKNKKLIFYCSIGYRSSTSIQRLSESAKAAGALSLANLRGGIFRWYNERHLVFNAEGNTDAIHPSASIWRLMLRERDQPEPAH